MQTEISDNNRQEEKREVSERIRKGEKEGEEKDRWDQRDRSKSDQIGARTPYESMTACRPSCQDFEGRKQDRLSIVSS